MSIMKSMNTGLSGLNANGRAMSMIGDNIANVNTTGFKAGRLNFSDVIGNTMLGIGDGVSAGSVQQLFDQGALDMTGQVTDLAIAGGGFFVVRGEVNGESTEFFSRAGQFVIDQEGFISSPQGLRLQGYGVDDEGRVLSRTGDLQVGQLTSPPQATSELKLELNLDSSAEVLTDPWDPANPAATSNFSSSTTLYDSLGNPVQAEVYYRKTADNQWEYRVLVDGENVQGGTPGTPSEISDGTLEFNTDGELVAHTPNAMNFQPVGATQPQDLALVFDKTTQYSGASTQRRASQDGWAAGEIRDLRIDADGSIVGVFSNGQESALGQVALANFEAPHELERAGGNLYKQTPKSGDPLVGVASSGGRGAIISGALEASNVDLAHEFVKMIAAQRGYQANSRTISTSDQMLQEVMNIKR